MITPITIGTKTFPINLIQGPLAGISTSVFRLLTWKLSRPAFSYSEMISCNALMQNGKLKQLRYLIKEPAEGPVCFQLLGNDPAVLKEATKIVTDCGADLIDLNCGCSVPKVRCQHSGSYLLSQPTKLYRLICAMKQSTHLPVSVKIRVDGNSKDNFNMGIVKVVADAGADCLVVHGRHWTENYDSLCHYDQIQFFVAEMKIPVIGNGNVADVNSLRQMFSTGCAGVMIGRAGIGQPWLIGKLIAEMQEQSFTLPSLCEVGEIFIEHVKRLANLFGDEKFAVLDVRKIAKLYARAIINRNEFCVAINKCEALIDFERLCREYFC